MRFFNNFELFKSVKYSTLWGLVDQHGVNFQQIMRSILEQLGILAAAVSLRNVNKHFHVSIPIRMTKRSQERKYLKNSHEDATVEALVSMWTKR